MNLKNKKNLPLALWIATLILSVSVFLSAHAKQHELHIQTRFVVKTDHSDVYPQSSSKNQPYKYVCKKEKPYHIRNCTKIKR